MLRCRVRYAVLALVVTSVIPLFAAKKYIPNSALPAPVLDAFKRAYPHAAVKSSSRDHALGTVAYGIQCVDGSVLRDVLYSADGHVLEMDEEIGPQQLPDAVRQKMIDRAAMRSAHTREEVVHVRRCNSNGHITYKITLRSGSVMKELRFMPDGSLPTTNTGP